jgi:hypothetical protein
MVIYAYIYLGLSLMAIGGAAVSEADPSGTELLKVVMRKALVVPFIGHILGWW